MFHTFQCALTSIIDKYLQILIYLQVLINLLIYYLNMDFRTNHPYTTKPHQRLFPHYSRSIQNVKPSDWRALHDRIHTGQHDVEIWTNQEAEKVANQLSFPPYQ